MKSLLKIILFLINSIKKIMSQEIIFVASREKERAFVEELNKIEASNCEMIDSINRFAYQLDDCDYPFSSESSSSSSSSSKCPLWEVDECCPKYYLVSKITQDHINKLRVLKILACQLREKKQLLESIYSEPCSSSSSSSSSSSMSSSSSSSYASSSSSPSSLSSSSPSGSSSSSLSSSLSSSSSTACFTGLTIVDVPCEDLGTPGSPVFAYYEENLNPLEGDAQYAPLTPTSSSSSSSDSSASSSSPFGSSSSTSSSSPPSSSNSSSSSSPAPPSSSSPSSSTTTPALLRVYYDLSTSQWKVEYSVYGVIAKLNSSDQCTPVGSYEILTGFPCAGQLINIF